jgi:hypothetical protein
MLTAVHATPKPTTTPITKPTKRAITPRLFSRNTFLPNALRHYAPKCLEVAFSEVQLRVAERSSVKRVMSSSCSQPSPVKE